MSPCLHGQRALPAGPQAPAGSTSWLQHLPQHSPSGARGHCRDPRGVMLCPTPLETKPCFSPASAPPIETQPDLLIAPAAALSILP